MTSGGNEIGRGWNRWTIASGLEWTGDVGHVPLPRSNEDAIETPWYVGLAGSGVSRACSEWLPRPPVAAPPPELHLFGPFGPGERPSGCNRAYTMLDEPASMRDKAHHDDKLRHRWKRRKPHEQDHDPGRNPEPHREQKTKSEEHTSEL